MSLSTLLEAAKYLDYLDSNPQKGQQQPQQINNEHTTQLQHYPKAEPTLTKRSSRRQRSSKKDAANTMVAMSLPTSTRGIQLQNGVPIPLASGSVMHGGHHASLSSSFTESPLSSFASTALLCSKASGVTSASSSSTASSLSSSDSSSSCGEILMGDNDFNQSSATINTNEGKDTKNQRTTSGRKYARHDQTNKNSSLELSYNNSHSLTSNQPSMLHKYGHGSYNDQGQSFARYIAATSTGPQLVTMTTTSSGGITSASAPIDGSLRAGHVIHAATHNTSATSGFNNDQHQFSIGSFNGRDSQTGYSVASSLGSDSHLSSSPGSCPPLIMARVQPMILNSISPSAHQSLMAFQQTHAAVSSPTSSSSSYSRHRELHKTLEKNRRAHLRYCFELLKSELPLSECADKKTSHINIIKSAIRFVLALRQQECEIDNELQRLTRIKNELTEKLSAMRNNSDHLQMDHQVELEPKELRSSAPVDHSSDPTASQPNAGRSQEWSPNLGTNRTKHEENSQHHQPAAEQQLSYLLSQSKID